MDHKDTIQKKMAVVLADLHAKIDQLKEKVDKLCENTNNCEPSGLTSTTTEKQRTVNKYKI